MNERIASIENLIARDPGERNIFGLVVADQLRLAAQSLRQGRRVVIVSGFYVPAAHAGETDGPPGAKIVGDALRQIGLTVHYVTDHWNLPLFRALGIEPTVLPYTEVEAAGVDPYARFLDSCQPTHVIAIERVGRGLDGRYRDMHGADITDTTAPLDELFVVASRRGLTTIGIGDGGNEIGMGNVFADTLTTIPHGEAIACTISTDFCIAAGVSNWGAYGLAGALSVLMGDDLLPSAEVAEADLVHVVIDGGGVDGVTHEPAPTVDGLQPAESIRMLENIRRQIVASPLEHADPLTVGIIGYGETGRAAAAFLARSGHRVCISDIQRVTLDPGTVVAGVESGAHTIDFLGACDLVVASPGIRADAEIRGDLHRRGIPVMSELELAYELNAKGLGEGRGGEEASSGVGRQRPLIAVTGTIGKRTTVELMQRLFGACGRSLTIGGNRGRPLSALLLDAEDEASSTNPPDPIAVAVSSFQLETVVRFRPHIAILLNLSVAHLDRHRSLAEYARIKSRVFMNQGGDDVLILPFDDTRLRSLARNHRGRTLFISTRQAVDRGAWLLDGALRMDLGGTVEELGPVTSPFPENLLVAVLAARLGGITTAQVIAALRSTELVDGLA